MKRLVATALVALMLASCQEAPKGYVINGEVTGRTEGKVYLKSFRNKMFFDVDTAELKEGKFTFKGEVDQPLLFGLATEDMNYPVQFFVENTNMDVRISNDGETITVRNSPVNTIFQENAEKVFEEGYDIDSLITNFHLPESTLLMLVSALAGKEHIMAAYEEAVKERYRFFSFGDAMMIE